MQRVPARSPQRGHDRPDPDRRERRVLDALHGPPLPHGRQSADRLHVRCHVHDRRGQGRRHRQHRGGCSPRLRAPRPALRAGSGLQAAQRQQLLENNEYFPNVSAAPQHTHPIASPGTWVYAVVVQNDGDVADDLVLTAPNVPSAPFGAGLLRLLRRHRGSHGKRTRVAQRRSRDSRSSSPCGSASMRVSWARVSSRASSSRRARLPNWSTTPGSG